MAATTDKRKAPSSHDRLSRQNRDSEIQQEQSAWATDRFAGHLGPSTNPHEGRYPHLSQKGDVLIISL